MTDPLDKIDILYLAWNRREFTEASLKALRENTDWSRVRRMFLYCDGIGQDDGTRDLMAEFVLDAPIGDTHLYVSKEYGGPCSIMNHYLELIRALWFAKIDNDVIVPPGWLPECLRVLRNDPRVDLLGIEATYPPAAVGECKPSGRGTEPTDHIGGIGLMRTACFTDPIDAHGRMGFSQWQIDHPSVVKAWLNPGLPVILLDRLPFEPWRSLSDGYIKKGWQRAWKNYTEADKAIWSWWRK